jgi:hypothetical protein
MNRTSSVDFQRAIHGISTALYVCLYVHEADVSDARRRGG